MVTKVKGGVLDESALSGKNMTGDIAFDTTTLKIDSSNNRVGIGTASPDELLVIDGAAKIRGTNKLSFTNTSDQTYIHAPASNTLAFGAGSAERMRLASDGDFFLNTTSAMDNCFASFQDGNNGEAMFGISAKDDSNVGIRFGVGTTRKWVNYRDTSDNLIWYSNANSAERMRIRSDGGVGIGNTGYSSTILSLHNGTGRSTLIYGDSGDANCDISLRDNSSSQNIVYGATGNNHVFKKDTTEVMRITSGGQVLIAHTSAVGSHNEKLGIDCDQAAGYGIFVSGDSSTGGSSNITAMRFYDSGSSAGIVGSIIFNDTVTAFNTSSDYRLKENITYSWDATTRLKQLKPARFNFIKNKDKTMDGFLAHEVSSIVPEAVSGEKDGEEMQELDQSKLVPLLVKTVQELEARITELESK